MSENKLRIAIVSDLHCHPTKVGDSPSTYLLTDKLRYPTNDHPVESLIKIINNEESKLKVDLTLCPGDFTDKASLQGLISGWEFSLEINRELESKNIIATIGNHDVDVYKNNSKYSSENVRGVKRGFPIKKEADRDIFWSKGCVFIEENEYRILVINSSHFHYDKESACKGEISPESIEYIESYLIQNNDSKIQIAMSHHPPIEHPRKNLGEDDRIVNGEQLLNLLGENNFDLFIYGHKHDPFIKYYSPQGKYRLPLFSAGSFSAGSNIMFAGLRNAFHIIELSKRQSKCKGQILTWTYLPEDGWKKNFDESAFAPISGFGNEKNIDQIFEYLKALLETKKEMSWIEISENIEDVNYLTPADSKQLYKLLKESGYMPDEHLWNNPKRIINLNLL
ncbi:metallophosphoesterase family protein [Formosa sp. 3Alg 14/1]|uniref:metallophosphoesterase family protein n=1 Tax=Formosa TaxID=225842 RepID=UPI0008261509|nr:metallophosphoesterase [Formosa haliotis]